MERKIGYLVFAIIGYVMCVGQGFSAWYDVCELKTFKATAYYSPEEDQSFYVQGSLEADKLLNGDGTHGASGSPVFNGMIAAPATYAFGTRIYIPKWGIGQVEDRGGAIVVSGERNERFDRLDFWAGKGEAGLKAALRFGVRYIDAYVCPKGVGGKELGFSFATIPLSVSVPKHDAESVSSFANTEATSLREVNLQPGERSVWTPILQRYLKTLGLLDSAVKESTYYGPQTKEAVCSYQKKYMFMRADSEWCGWFGKQTRASLQQHLHIHSNAGIYIPENLGNKKEIEQEKNEVHPVQEATRAKDNGTVTHKKDIANRLFAEGGEFADYEIGPLQPGDSGQEVRILQRKLQRLGHYPYEQEITGVYDDQTIRAIYAFQVASNIVTNETDPTLFGFFGPKTRSFLNSA